MKRRKAATRSKDKGVEINKRGERLPDKIEFGGNGELTEQFGTGTK